MYVRQLFMEFCRVKLDFLEARLRSVEQLDRQLPWEAQARTTLAQGAGASVVEKSRLLRGNQVLIIKGV
jgi:hypothetical protein